MSAHPFGRRQPHDPINGAACFAWGVVLGVVIAFVALAVLV